MCGTRKASISFHISKGTPALSSNPGVERKLYNKRDESTLSTNCRILEITTLRILAIIIIFIHISNQSRDIK